MRMLKSEKTAIGKKVKDIKLGYRQTAIRFNDDSILVIEAISDGSYSSGEMSIDAGVDIYELAEMGVISEEEADAERIRQEKLEARRKKDARRRQYLKLREEFDGDFKDAPRRRKKGK